MKRTVLTALTLLLTAGAASAAIINVNPGDSLQTAINSAAPSGDEIVIAPGTYVGSALIENKSLTIRGSDPNNRPVIAVTQSSSGSFTGGILTRGDNVQVVFQDLIVIPSGTVNRGIAAGVVTNNANLTVTVANVLIAPNDGSNVPSVTDIFDDATPLGTRFTSDGLYLLGRDFGVGTANGNATLNIIDTTIIGVTRDAIVAYPNGAEIVPPSTPQPATTGGSLFMSGVKISRAGRNATQIGNNNLQTGDVVITGTRSNPGLLARNVNTTAAASTANTGIVGAGNVLIDHLVYLNSPGTYFVNAANIAGFTMTDSLFATIASDGLGLRSTAVPPVPYTATVEDSTFFSIGAIASTTAGIWLQTSGVTLNVNNSIFAGTATQAGLVVNAGVGTAVTVNGNGFVLNGPNALGQAYFGGGAPDVTEVGSVNDDPQFTGTTITSLADLTTAFNVTNAAYSGIGGGFGDVITSVPGWMMY